MKRKCAAFVAVLAFAAVAQAGGWRYIGRGVYQGDSYYWTCYQKCGCWYYQKLCPVAQLPAVGTPTFWEKMAELGARTEELQSEADYVRSRYPGRYPVGSNTLTTGYNVLTQGYQQALVQGGTTLQATGAYVSPVDVNGLVHEAQRLQELAAGNSSQANSQVNSIVSTAVEGNSAAARIMAAGQVAAATIAASMPPPQTSTTIFQSRQVQGQAPQAATASFSQASPSPSDAVALLSHGLLMQNCAKCHDPLKHKGNMDVTGDPVGLAEFRDEIIRRIHLPPGNKDKMPPDPAPNVSEPVANGLVAGIPVRQRFAAAQNGLPIPPQAGDQPPAPPTDGTLPAPQN